MTAPNAERAVHIQMEAAKKLMDSLKEQGLDGDAELIADSIEGETNFLEAIEAALAEIDEREILKFGLREKIKTFGTREKQQDDAIDRIRALIEQAMMATDQTSLKLTTATISLRKVAPGLVITNEADIPARFWVEQPRPAPKLDKKALAEALKAGEAIEGAALDNGSLTLSVRRR